ncbi:MAG TPA: histidine kinase [Vicinamibacteria bacterium]|nr:histidine kinase [Vicinamibacteria bacterium]
MSWKVVATVATVWALVGLVSGAQASLAAALQGQASPLGPSIADGLHQFLPWIPATLVAIGLAGRFPLTRTSWRRNLWLHLLAIPATAFLTNLIVVATYWLRSGTFRGLGVLVQQAGFWALVRMHFAALFYVAAVAAAMGIRSWRDLRRREVEMARLETQLAQARLQALNAQIRPHFLFNTLHAIGQLWRSGRSREADAMLDHLGALFQKVIASTARTQVPLSEELAMVRDYLAIEEVRFGARVRSRVEADRDTLACLVPPLLLQPLVENAVKHGLSPSAAGGTVTVEARVEGERLVLLVRDDGTGPNGGHAPGTGTGLSNVRERLASLYGERQRLVTGPGPDGGTEVRVELPVLSDDAHG